ncbi:MAG: hypothetical protein R6U27_06585 [Desulfobacterales bacterium]
MPKKKSVSFDAMVKFFMKHYKIPTKKDVDKLVTKLDRLEIMVREAGAKSKTIAIGGRDSKTRIQVGKPGMTASDMVLEIIREAGDEGAGFLEIQDKTGFGEKKIRNIVFRLNKLERIKRKNRGVYVAA